MTEVFAPAGAALQPGRKPKVEVAQDPMHGKDEQVYEPSDDVRMQWAQDENVAGGMGGAGCEDGDGGESSEEEMDLAGAK